MNAGMDTTVGALNALNKLAPMWVHNGVGRLVMGEQADAGADQGLPTPSPGKKAAVAAPTSDAPKESLFPGEIVIANYAQWNHRVNVSLCKSMIATIAKHGEPTYEQVKAGEPGVSAQELAAIWTDHRVRMLRSGKKFQQAVATLAGLWMQHLAQPDDGINEMRHSFEKESIFDPGPAGFERIKKHILDYVRRVVR